jgi:hypothetical protein
MIKNKLKDMPVLYIHIEPNDKESLRVEAQKRGMQLTTYCRMMLLDSLRQNDTNRNKH